MIKRKWLIIVVVVAILAAYFGRGIFLSTGHEEEKATTVKRGKVEQKLILSGTIEAEEYAQLSFQASGLLSWVGVKEGDWVNKYQAIASLDQRELKKKLDKELNDYLTARWDLEQKREDYKDTPVTNAIKRIVDESQFGVNKSVLDVEIQDLAIKLSTITTPIAGVVTNVETPYPGVNVALNKTLFEIVNPDTFYIEVTADQTEVVELHQGMAAVITLDPYPDEEITGEIETISLTPKEDETGTVYKAKVKSTDLKKKDHNYRVGMTGDVTFITKQKDNVLYVPISFVKSDEKGDYLMRGDKKEKIYIQTGIEGEDVMEISGDITEGDTIYDL